MTAFVTAAQLKDELATGAAPKLLDVRWSLATPNGRPAYEESHLPGAVYVDLDTQLSDHSKTGLGRHPLPEPAALQEAARRWGLRNGAPVVVYDDGPGLAAGRAWWLLRHAGLTDVRILSGGLAAWVAAGGRTQDGDIIPMPGDVDLSWGHMSVIDADGASSFAETGVLLDARAGERYRGETEPIDPRAGHIPGAISVPTAGNVGADGTFLAAEELRARFAAAGADGSTPVAVYCGSGVTAAHQIAALASVGIDAALFPGSWSQWSGEAQRPVAVG